MKELQKKAENFIIERYKIAKCYREYNAETREYMRMDVHSQYEEEYQLYLAAAKELQEENAELKKDKKELCHSISEGGKACVYLNGQLTKATEIIKKLYTVFYAPCVTESDLKYRDELFAEIKQFLSEVGK